jgi:oxygen-dependent protoporphyrinogen oxidase
LPRDPDVVDAVVVGGGLSGLRAAHVLSRAGARLRLLEASADLGGVVRTESHDGFLCEGGPDTLLAQKPAGLELCRELGLADRLIPTNLESRRVYVLRRGRLHSLPEGMVLAVPTRAWPLVRSGLFSLRGKARMGLDLLMPRRREAADESIASFVRRRLGAEALERLGEPLLAGIHAGDPETLSMQACFPRFVEMEARTGSLIRGMGKAAASRPDGAAFYSLRGGLRELVDALAARLPEGSINKEEPVLSLEREDGGFVVRTATRTLRARAVVLALPPRKSKPLLAALEPAAAALLGALTAVDTAVVLLAFRREDVGHALDGYGLIVPRNEGLRTTACGFFSTKFPGRAPAGHVLLRGFLGGARDPRILEADDAALAATVVGELRGVLGLRGEPTLTRVFRWPQATPQLEVGHLGRVADVDRQVRGVPGLFLTGAGLRATGIPDVVADATTTALDAAAFLGRQSAAILAP